MNWLRRLWRVKRTEQALEACIAIIRNLPAHVDAAPHESARVEMEWDALEAALARLGRRVSVYGMRR